MGNRDALYRLEGAVEFDCKLPELVTFKIIDFHI